MLTMIGSGLMFCSCSCQQQNKNDGEEVDGVEVIEVATQAFYMIPDHAKVSEDAMKFMSKDLYDALLCAWNVPRWTDGEIGEEEFLYYFITGNDPSDRQVVKSADLVSKTEDRYFVEVKYLESWGDKSAASLSSITLVLVNEDGKILLDDFGNGIKEQCKSYIRNEVKNFLSGATTSAMLSNQTPEWYTSKHIHEVENSFKTYVAENEQYLVSLGCGSSPLQ